MEIHCEQGMWIPELWVIAGEGPAKSVVGNTQTQETISKSLIPKLTVAMTEKTTRVIKQDNNWACATEKCIYTKNEMFCSWSTQFWRLEGGVVGGPEHTEYSVCIYTLSLWAIYSLVFLLKW